MIWYGRRGHVSEATRRPPTPEELALSPEAVLEAAAADAEAAELEDRALAALDALPIREAEVLALRVAHPSGPRPWLEVSARLGITVGRARSLEARALARLRAMLAEEDP